MQQPTPQPNQGINKGTIVMMSIIALFFAYIVTKNVNLPKMVLIGGTVVVAFILFFKGMQNPHIITYALVAYLPFSKELAGDFGGLATAFNFTNLLMAFMIFTWITGRYAKDEPLWIRTPLNWPIVLFMLLGLVSIVRGTYYGTGYLPYAIVEYKRWITPFFLYFLVLNTVKEELVIRNVVIIMIVVTTVVGLMAIYEYIDIGYVSSLEKNRVGGIAGQPNMLAAFFNYYMFLPAGFLLMNMKRAKYWLLLIPMLICFRGIMVTFSRGGYLAFAAALYGIVFIRSKILFALLVGVTVLALLNPILLPAGIRYRMGQTFEQGTYVEDFESAEEGLESSAQSRLVMWRTSLDMIHDYALFGIGYGLFPLMVPNYLNSALVKKVKDPHNTYLLIAAEMGIPALLVFLLIIFLIMWHTWSLYRQTQNHFIKSFTLGVLGGLFGLLMSNMFGSRLDSQEVSSYFWILAALIMRLKMIDGMSLGLGKPKKIGYRLEGEKAS